VTYEAKLTAQASGRPDFEIIGSGVGSIRALPISGTLNAGIGLGTELRADTRRRMLSGLAYVERFDRYMVPA
jgi:hypothetical protein